MKISTSEMARIAHHLILAHLFIVLLTLLTGLFSMIGNILLSNTLNDLESSTGETSTTSAAGALGIALDVIMRLFFPVLFLFLAYLAVQGNNSCLMQCVCCCDGFGIVLMIGGSALALLALTVLSAAKTWAEAIDCDDYYYSGDYTKQDCKDSREALISLTGTLTAFYVITLIIALASAGLCVWATVSAQQGAAKLTTGEVFVGKAVEARGHTANAVPGIYNQQGQVQPQAYGGQMMYNQGQPQPMYMATPMNNGQVMYGGAVMMSRE